MSKWVSTLLGLLLVASSAVAGGGEVWIATFDGTMGLQDQARGIAVDPSGCVFVVGETNYASEPVEIPSSLLLIKFSPDGDTLWTHVNDSASSARYLVVDDSGCVYVAGESKSDTVDFLVLKYGPEGDSIWAATYKHPVFTSDEIRGIVLDPNRNLYLLGDVEDLADDEDIALVKILPDGSIDWVSILSGPAGDDQPEGIAVDNSGHIAVVGSSRNSDSATTAIWTIMYDASGDTVWTARYGGSTTCYALSVGTDDEGSVYVAGELGEYETADCIFIKYSAAGVFQWDWTYSGPAGLRDYIGDLHVGGDGSVWLSIVRDYDFFGYDPRSLVGVRLNSDGNERWARTFYSPSPTGDGYESGGTSVAVDANQNAVFGYSPCWPHTVKYSPEGDLLWWRPFAVDSAGLGTFRDLAADQDGNVYVIGEVPQQVSGTEWLEDIVLYKYPASCCLLRGDMNESGGVTVADITFLIGYVFRGGPPPYCLTEADVSGDGHVTVVDVTSLIAYVFRGGPAPAGC